MKTALSKAKVPFTLRTLDPHISDLMGVLAGVKPVLYTDISPDDEGYIKNLCSGFGLLYLKPETKAGKHFHFRSDKFMVLIGRSRELLKAAAKSWREMDDAEAWFDWGCLLGYPECCVRRYRPWTDPKRAASSKAGFVKEIFENTRTSRKFSFLLNNVFNFFSMPYRDGPEKDIALYNRIVQLNRLALPLPNLNVISWHPCSYDCAESLRRAKLTYGMMERYMPGWAATLSGCLSRPVLFMEKYKFLVFNKASVSGARNCAMKVTHAGLTGPVSLLDAGTLARADSEKVLFADARGVFSSRKEPLISSVRSGSPVFLNFGK